MVSQTLENKMDKVLDTYQEIKDDYKEIKKDINTILNNHLAHMEVYMSQLCKKNNIPYTEPNKRNPKPDEK